MSAENAWDMGIRSGESTPDKLSEDPSLFVFVLLWHSK